MDGMDDGNCDGWVDGNRVGYRKTIKQCSNEKNQGEVRRTKKKRRRKEYMEEIEKNIVTNLC